MMTTKNTTAALSQGSDPQVTKAVPAKRRLPPHYTLWQCTGVEYTTNSKGEEKRKFLCDAARGSWLANSGVCMGRRVDTTNIMNGEHVCPECGRPTTVWREPWVPEPHLPGMVDDLDRDHAIDLADALTNSAWIASCLRSCGVVGAAVGSALKRSSTRPWTSWMHLRRRTAFHPARRIARRDMRGNTTRGSLRRPRPRPRRLARRPCVGATMTDRSTRADLSRARR